MVRFRRHFAGTQSVAELLRKRQTPQEALLWRSLRNRRLMGLKIRRQHPIGPYIVDFCCAERRLIVEIDGAGHAAQVEYDVGRSLYLEAAGYHVIRFTNAEVERELGRVLGEIALAADRPHPRPLSHANGRGE